MKNKEKKLILGCSIGNCVHIAGVSHFLQIAEQEGYETKLLGAAISIEELFENIQQYKPYIVGISYRLTPENVRPLLDKVKELSKQLDYQPIWDFGGTKPVSEIAKEYEMFSYISDGTDDISDTIRFLRGQNSLDTETKYANNVIERIKANYPYPILRHHFGLPNVEQTALGIEKIAKSKILDVISLGTDQNAQEYFFKPEKMKPEFDGAGGVPIRSRKDLKTLKEAANCGNYPLMRCYSGTDDVFPYAEMLEDTIENAWTAIPLCWYNELDKRGPRELETSIKEAQKLIKWHAEKNIPVEINEPHHWGLRDAHDVIPVAMAYISAYNAKKLGVKNYIAQYMFNNPSTLSFSMDLAKILAMIEMVESLEDENFKTYRETRAGLPLFSADEDVAKGQLASSTFMQMTVKPHIMHVVAYCEADHAAQPEDVIASCKIVKGVIKHTLNEQLSIEKDEKINLRKEELISEAKVLIGFIEKHYSKYEDPLTNSEVISDCIKKGYIDAVHIIKDDKFRGNLKTKIVNGMCVACDEKGNRINEKERIMKLIEKNEPEVIQEYTKMKEKKEEFIL